ncbi:MAG: CBS domain-containing protein [Trueperaceae bacterium]|nr:CBS domain-containing protein [Trueperaceae bacterium]
MKTVRDVLEKQQLKDIPSISAEASVYAAITLMSERHLSSLIVLEKKQLVGAVHERDCLEKILLWGQRSRETRVKEIMRKNPMTVRPSDSLETCIIYMLTEQVSQLPVLEKGGVLGVITTEDILKAGLKRPGIVPQAKPSMDSKPVNNQDDRSWSGRSLN